MWSLAFLIVGAISNATMDTVTHHWYKFRWREKVNPQWWNASISWENKYNSKLPVQFTDAWHLFKTTMIFAIVGAIVTYQPMINPWIDFAILGTTWNIIFSIFYKHILVK